MTKDENRMRLMNRHLIPVFERMFYKRTTETLRWYEEMRSQYADSFLHTVKEGFQSVEALQALGVKDTPRYMYCSFLLSDVFLNQMRLKLDFYDARHFYDIEQVECYWDYSELYPFIDEDMEFLRKELTSNFIRIMDYEVFELKRQYYIGLYRITGEILRLLLRENVVADFLEQQSGHELHVYFGEYLGQSVLIT